MAKGTTRDQLWTYAMKRTHRDEGQITASELSKMAQTSERTARDVLKTMVDNGILRLDQKGRKVRYVAEWEEYE